MAEDQAVCLNLVDINQKTVEQSWPLLLQAVEKAHFNAVDLVSCMISDEDRD